MLTYIRYLLITVTYLIIRQWASPENQLQLNTPRLRRAFVENQQTIATVAMFQQTVATVATAVATVCKKSTWKIYFFLFLPTITIHI